jgi:hypothetical protein
MESSPEITLKNRSRLCLAAWVVGFLASGAPYPGMLRFAWAFPVGLPALFIPSLWTRGYAAAAVTGWIFYAALTVYCLLQKRRATYFVIYGVLCTCLLLNVAGCQVELRGS